ncbi:Mor transcription activator family protein [Acidovorax sp. M14]|uniref:Mor transcription activator family protein n=1 Tax=Acidovorax sp. M14 TaxID=3411354 RepID=UPI003BF5943E
MTHRAEAISIEFLPPLLQDFERLIGLEPTMALVRHSGGLRIYIPTPERVTADHIFAHVIGLENLLKLAEVYGGESHFQLPKAERALIQVRNARIAQAYTTHKTARELAVEYHLTERQVERILAAAGAEAPEDRRQAVLF